MDIRSPVLEMAEKLLMEKRLLAEEVAALESQAKQVQANIVALRARMQELDQCNALLGENFERVCLQVQARQKELEAYLYSLDQGRKNLKLFVQNHI